MYPRAARKLRDGEVLTRDPLEQPWHWIGGTRCRAVSRVPQRFVRPRPWSSCAQSCRHLRPDRLPPRGSRRASAVHSVRVRRAPSFEHLARSDHADSLSGVVERSAIAREVQRLGGVAPLQRGQLADQVCRLDASRVSSFERHVSVRACRRAQELDGTADPSAMDEPSDRSDDNDGSNATTAVVVTVLGALLLVGSGMLLVLVLTG